MASSPSASNQTSPSGPNPQVVGAFVLMTATVAALIFANTGLADVYKALLNTPISLDVVSFQLADSLKNWVKNLLMAIFFLFVGLEIKAEFAEGALSDRKRAILPFAGAIGGMGRHLPRSFSPWRAPTRSMSMAGPFRRQPTSLLRSRSWRCSARAFLRPSRPSCSRLP